VTARTCTACQGNGGRTETTTSGGVTRQTWRTCTACRGTGSR
jgi:DnaJ-class molecular chaperone